MIDVNKLNKIADKAIEEHHIDKLVAISLSLDVAMFEVKNEHLNLLPIMQKCDKYLRQYDIYPLFSVPIGSHKDLDEMGLI